MAQDLAETTVHRWRDLDVDAELLRALEVAGPRPATDTMEKRKWGKRFADACAVMFANAIRRAPTLKHLEIRPNQDGTGQESLTGVGGGDQKKVDVIASTLASGLQIALSLKAENFASDDGYGKNLKNRLYELQDEVRAIHEYQPRAYVVGVFFLPLDSTTDKRDRSSFARTVANLRARTGRIDFTLPGQLNRLDWAAVGLYEPSGSPQGPPRGAVRYFDVRVAPPRVGRPKLETTITLQQLIEVIAVEYQRDTGEALEYAEPETD